MNMLFAHSFSIIEKQLSKRLKVHLELLELDCKEISSNQFLEHSCAGSKHKTLLYSFQQLEFYQHINTFKQECAGVERLIDYAIDHQFEKIILMTYPGAYYNAGNLFLQHKGIIEQKFVASGIECCLLNIQGIVEPFQKLNNLHELFYDLQDHKYIIPLKSNSTVYSVKMNNLVEIILKAKQNPIIGKYDVFDNVYHIESFLQEFSPVLQIQKVPAIYLYFKTFVGSYASLTMLELFLQPVLQMYKFRTEKEFGVALDFDNHPNIYPTEEKKSNFLIDSNPYLERILWNA